MAVGRYKDSVNIVSENHADFVRWLFLSVAIHLIPALVVVLLPTPPKKVFYSPVYEVTLLTGPEIVKPQDAPKEGIPQKEDVPPHEEPKEEPKLKIEVKDIKHKPKIKKPKAVTKSRKEIVVSKLREDAARPDEAVKKMREKIATEEAVEEAVSKIRKKDREKEIASSGGIKIAARAPARVYHVEELDAELRAYFERISRIVRDAWALPEGLRNKGFKTILSIHIRKDGTVESLWVEEGSGNRFFDESAQRAINKASPLPPLPKNWKEESIDLGLRF